MKNMQRHKNNLADKKKHIDIKLIKKVLERFNSVVEKEQLLISQEKFSEAHNLIASKMELVAFFEENQEHILNILQSEDKEEVGECKLLVRNLLDKTKDNIIRTEKAELVANETVEISKTMLKLRETMHSSYSKKGKKSAGSGSMFINTKT